MRRPIGNVGDLDPGGGPWVPTEPAAHLHGLDRVQGRRLSVGGHEPGLCVREVSGARREPLVWPQRCVRYTVGKPDWTPDVGHKRHSREAGSEDGRHRRSTRRRAWASNHGPLVNASIPTAHPTSHHPAVMPHPFSWSGGRGQSRTASAATLASRQSVTARCAADTSRLNSPWLSTRMSSMTSSGGVISPWQSCHASSTSSRRSSAGSAIVSPSARTTRSRLLARRSARLTAMSFSLARPSSSRRRISRSASPTLQVNPAHRLPWRRRRRRGSTSRGG
jgi:hypothetical protein